MILDETEEFCAQEGRGLIYRLVSTAVNKPKTIQVILTHFWEDHLRVKLEVLIGDTAELIDFTHFLDKIQEAIGEGLLEGDAVSQNKHFIVELLAFETHVGMELLLTDGGSIRFLRFINHLFGGDQGV